MSTANLIPSRVFNGVDAARLEQLAQGCANNPRNASVKFAVTTHWTGGTTSTSRVAGYELAGRTIPRSFAIVSDEPQELCGSNAAPNPQELLMASLSACMMVGYVAGATLAGIKLESLVIETGGKLDLRGFLGLDAAVKPGYADGLHYVVRIKGDAAPEQFQRIHETVMATSPNRWNVSNPIRLTSELVVE
ncbi:MAG: OsmC family protein [Tepidisphaeraceae bacterium]